MRQVVFRVWLLWGLLTLIINVTFGFNQWVRMWELVEVSKPQVDAFWQGITTIGWQQVPFVLLAFIYRKGIFFLFRRTVILVVKKLATFVAIVLLETHWRRFIARAMLAPGYYAKQSIHSVRNWHELNDYLLLRSWFLHLYTAAVLTTITFVGVELILSIIRGTLSLPPLVVRYQAKLITFAGAFVVASVAQWFLLFLWGRFYHRLPAKIHEYIWHLRWPVLRKLVYLRRWRVSVTSTLFRWNTWLLGILMALLSGGGAL